MFSTKRRMWRHVKTDDSVQTDNSVQKVGIHLNFFCDFLTSKWPIVPIFTRIGPLKECFLKNVGYDATSEKWWRHCDGKNVGIDPILLRHFFFAVLNNCDDFWKISFAGTLLFTYTSFWWILVRLPSEEMPSVTSRWSDTCKFRWCRRRLVIKVKSLPHLPLENDGGGARFGSSTAP